MTLQIKRLATLIQFRSLTDLTQPQELIRLGCRVTTFKGTILGTINDGFDVIAAFHTREDAARFIDVYHRDHEKAGLRFIGSATI